MWGRWGSGELALGPPSPDGVGELGEPWGTWGTLPVSDAGCAETIATDSPTCRLVERARNEERPGTSQSPAALPHLCAQLHCISRCRLHGPSHRGVSTPTPAPGRAVGGRALALGCGHEPTVPRGPNGALATELRPVLAIHGAPTSLASNWATVTKRASDLGFRPGGTTPQTSALTKLRYSPNVSADDSIDSPSQRRAVT